MQLIQGTLACCSDSGGGGSRQEEREEATVSAWLLNMLFLFFIVLEKFLSDVKKGKASFCLPSPAPSQRSCMEATRTSSKASFSLRKCRKANCSLGMKSWRAILLYSFNGCICYLFYNIYQKFSAHAKTFLCLARVHSSQSFTTIPKREANKLQ